MRRHVLKISLYRAFNLKVFSRYESIFCEKLQYKEHGDPAKVVAYTKEELKQVCTGEVLVKMLAAPVHPVDINVIQGVYPLKPKLPAVPGNEGVGTVMQTGPDVTSLKEGDKVILTSSCLGSWRTHAIFQEHDLAKIPSDIPLVEAATLTINPFSAYRMLKDYKRDLKNKDCIIQNGANSACGQTVIQICKIWGIRNIGIVRKRPKLDELKQYLENLGATLILTEDELASTTIFKEGKFPRPILGLNCIGGKNGHHIVRHLEPCSVLVTYGGMSRQPVTAPTSAFIFRNISIKGFWVTQWTKSHRETPEYKNMFDNIISYVKDGKLKAPVFEMVGLKDFSKILKTVTDKKGFTGKKFIFDLTK